MSDLLPNIPPPGPPRPGYRLHKLEVCNWGTFDSTDGRIHTVRPGGQTTLLIGQNGSGKSTMADALLTLLVRPAARNYNVAAGASRQERDEHTYIKGAFGRHSRDEDNRGDVQFLRPAGNNFSVLLACFRNEGTGDAFTLAQVLHLHGEGKVDRVYCWSAGERSIAADCAGLAGTDRLRQQMEKRGFRATTGYTEYHSWFAKAVGVRPKAMDMFNQTVAVKDIQGLNRFIREHMLEARPWNEKVEALLSHFTQLSEAHRALVRVRRQAELLEPVADKGRLYREQAGRLADATRLLEATDSFFRHKTVELLTPVIEARRAALSAAQAEKERLGRDIAEAAEEARRLRNEMEQAGGERLRQIPLLIRGLEAEAAAKRDANRRLHAALSAAGIAAEVADAAGLAEVRGKLAELLPQVAQQVAAVEESRVESAMERRRAAAALAEEERELSALTARSGNLPEYLAEMRQRLCDQLRLPESDLPFAAELIAVRPEESAWEASIEMVLRGFALSLLVPPEHYAAVSAYVDRTRLADARGRGRKLVYLRVGSWVKAAGADPSPRSLLRKLDLREGHPLLTWVRGELEHRFDYRCCETIEEFQSAHDLALTRERHLKARGVRHEKDDREATGDPRNFVLGWDNADKRRRLAGEVIRLRGERDRLDRDVARVEADLSRLRSREAAAQAALAVADFGVVDAAATVREIETLRAEMRTLQDESDPVRLLRERLAESLSRQESLQAARDGAVRGEGRLEREIADAQRLVAESRATLDRRGADGLLAEYAARFAELEKLLTEPLAAADLFPREQAFKDARRGEADRLRGLADPLQVDLTAAMNRFLREFPDARADLEARPQYLDGFLALREEIAREDLPRHERRFKERLDERVIQELGLLNAALQAERGEIASRIDLLNRSLRQLEYRPGTHMRLEARPVRDREIAEFRDALRECLAAAFEGAVEADETRYLKIEGLLSRLRQEQRWREKVTDVRRWFDFAAREIENATGRELGYFEDSAGQSGGEKAKLAFTILVAAIAYQYDIDPQNPAGDRFQLVVVDEMFSKVDDQHAEYALELFRKFGLQLLIVAPLDAKARVTEPYVGCYLHVVRDAKTGKSEVFGMTAREFEEAVQAA